MSTTPVPRTTSEPEKTAGIFSPPGRAGALGHGDRFARQHGLVDQQLARFQQHAIGRDAVALRHQHDIAADDLPPRDAPGPAVPDHQGARARHRAQGVENLLAADLLHDRDRHRQGGEGEQHDSAHQVAEGGVDRPARQQQAEHRLAQYLQGNLPEATRTGGRKLVRAIGREAPPGLLLREAGGGRCHDGPVRGLKSVATALVIIGIAGTRLSLADWSA